MFHSRMSSWKLFILLSIHKCQCKWLVLSNFNYSSAPRSYVFMCIYLEGSCLSSNHLIFRNGGRGVMKWSASHATAPPSQSSDPWGSAFADLLFPLFQALWACPVLWLPVLYFFSQHTSNCSFFRYLWKPISHWWPSSTVLFIDMGLYL